MSSTVMKFSPAWRRFLIFTTSSPSDIRAPVPTFVAGADELFTLKWVCFSHRFCCFTMILSCPVDKVEVFGFDDVGLHDAQIGVYWWGQDQSCECLSLFALTWLVHVEYYHGNREQKKKKQQQNWAFEISIFGDLTVWIWDYFCSANATKALKHYVFKRMVGMLSRCRI